MQFALRGAEAFAASEVYDADVDWDAVDAAAEANGGNWQGSEWSVRRVALHVLAEISQHACHADIIREAIDGQRTMG